MDRSNTAATAIVATDQNGLTSWWWRLVALTSTVALLLTSAVAVTPAEAQTDTGLDIAVVCPPAEPVSDAAFGDTGVHGAAIDCFAQYGIVNGLDDGTFGTNDPLRRDQMASIILRYLEAALGSDVPAAVPAFEDVDPDSVHADAIGALADIGIVEGVDAAMFDPAGTVTRAQMATFIVRTLDFLDDGEVNGSFPPAGEATFTDVVEGSTHAGNIDALVALGIALGLGDGRFGPGDPVLRGQVVTFFARAAVVLLDAGTWAPGPGVGIEEDRDEDDGDIEPDTDEDEPIGGGGGGGGTGGGGAPDPDNAAPVIEPIDDQTATEDVAFGPLDVVVTDADGDEVTVGVDGLPTGLEFDAEDNKIFGTPELGTAEDSPYTVTVTADDGEDVAEVSFEFTVEEAPDTTPPDAPANLEAVAGDGQIELTWDPVDDEDLAGYEVLRSDEQITSLDDALVVPGGPLTDTSFADSNVVNGTTYHYAVVAVDESGNVSELSNGVEATPQAPNVPPSVEPIEDQTATEGVEFGPLSVVASDDDGDVLTVTVSVLPDGLSFDPSASTIGGTPELGTAGEYLITVTADDGQASVDETFTLTIEEAPALDVTCPLVSILECGEVPVTLPYSIDWTADAGGLGDADGAGTGFTAVDPPTERLSFDIDGTSTEPTFEDAPGYEPSRLMVDEVAGTLTIDASKGIMYRDNTGSSNTNSQLNALSVGVEADGQVLEIETTVEIDLPTVTNSQQAGIWFGLDEDNYVKLVLSNQTSTQAKVQLLREIDAVAVPASEYELNSPNIAQDQPVTLVLRVDGIDNTVSATYQVGDGEVVELVDTGNTVSTTALPIPEPFTQGATLSDGETGPVSFAGLFATSRNATTADALIDAAFSTFSVMEVEVLEAPAAPTGLAGALVDGAVELDWDPVDGADGYLVYRSIDDGFDPADGTLLTADAVSATTFADADVAAGTTYFYVVTAVNEGGESGPSSQVSVEVPAVSESCFVISLLACDEVPVPLPFGLDFGSDAGGLTDGEGVGTGFTMVDPPSAPLGDQPDPDDPQVPGYVSQLLSVDGGSLTIEATKGIQFSQPSSSPNTNSQVNGLGVGVDARDTVLELTTTLQDLTWTSDGDNAQQAGLWFFIDEDTYVKLVAVKSGSDVVVEMLRETDGLVNTNMGDSIRSEPFPSGQDVELRLEIDALGSNASATAFYTADDGEVEVGSFGVNANLIDGVMLPDGQTGPTSFAGIFTTKRNAAADQAQSFAFADFGVAEVEEGPVRCLDISLLACDEVPVSLPFGLDFGSDAGGLADGEGVGTGFTMVDPPSERLEQDGTPTFDEAPGYEPSLLGVESGQLTITTTKGIMYASPLGDGSNTTSTDTNSQINALGVGIDASEQAFEVSTTVAQPSFPTVNEFQQGGLWFGLDEDNYAKVVVRNDGGTSLDVEFLVEIDSDVPSGNSVLSESFGEGDDVTLMLVADPDSQALTASYAVGSGDPVELGTLQAPDAFFAGVQLGDGGSAASFAGIKATQRRADDSVELSFADFAVVPVADDPSDPAVPFEVQVNFQSDDADVPAGFLRDFGEAFGDRTGADQGDGLSYGWVDPDSGTPLSLVGNGRDRDRAGVAQELDTIIHLQYGDVGGTNGVDDTGAWEIAVPDGIYEVTVSVGDEPGGGDVYDSTHVVNVESGVAIEGFQASASEEYLQATVTVDVRDGRLTVDPRGGVNTKLNYLTIERVEPVPIVIEMTPPNRSTSADVEGAASASISAPGLAVGVDPATLSGNVSLSELSSGQAVAGTVGSSGGNDNINFDPNEPLAPFTTYRFEITAGVLDGDGNPFVPFVSVFTTGSGETVVSDEFEPVIGVSFDQIEQPEGGGLLISTMEFGPDGKLYVTTIGQGIHRFDVAEDGTLSNREQLTALTDRAVIGFEFDADATADDLRVWTTHSSRNIRNEEALFDGRVTVLSGPDLAEVTDVFVNLPRSRGDHLVNSMRYGPDGALYFLQGSNQGAGDQDGAWGDRGETLLTAALLRFDPAHPDVVAALNGGSAIDVRTVDRDGSYNPFDEGAPLELYATGLRNAYDLVWHSNGELYVPTNGTASGNSPGVEVQGDGTLIQRGIKDNGRDVTDICATRRIDGPYTGPSVPAASHGNQRDFIYRVEEGGYYGHPNPERCEWVLNAGGTGEGAGSSIPLAYNDVLPDRNFRGWTWDLEFNKSANGVIEYRSATFDGQLQGRVLTPRFSNNNDVLFLQVDSVTREIIGQQTPNGVSGVPDSQIPGAGGFKDPLDIIEDPRNGNLYVNQYDRGGGDQKLFLLRVPEDQRAAGLTSTPDELVFSAAVSFNAGQNAYHVESATFDVQSVSVTNTGSEPVTLDLELSGPQADEFSIVGDANPDVAAGASVDVEVRFDAASSGERSAVLTVGSGDGTIEVPLYALAASGLEGGNEPTFKQVVNVLGFPIDVGWTSLTSDMSVPIQGDEVLEPLFERAGTGPVEVLPVAAYAPFSSVPFGLYDPSDGTLNEVGVMAEGQQQTLNPQLSEGGVTIDPGDGAFGIYTSYAGGDQTIYTEDDRNGGTHAVRVYPAIDRAGQPLADTYILGFEEASNGDYQDYVLLVSNVRPAGQAPSFDALRFNFQSADAPVPGGYLRDFGQAFGPRTGADQGTGLVYGWVEQADASTPLSLTGNGRDRGANDDQRLDTLLHMQLPPVSDGGALDEGAWKLELPDGTYQVTVSVGDPNNGAAEESHTINVQGVNIIDAFPKSTAPNGSDDRHTTGSAVVDVIDGELIVDAIGGINTKINYVDVEPVSSDGTIQVNFQTSAFPTPSGWQADTGLPFDEQRGYGWVVPGTSTPIDKQDSARVRSGPAAEPTFRTFNITQSDPVDTEDASWEIEVPSGVYTVTAGVGDAEYFDSSHSIDAEGISLISEFVPSAQNPFSTGSAEVIVTDGRLTVDAGFLGSNTKLSWIRIEGDALDCEGDCIDPLVSVTVDGTQALDGDGLANEATVTIEAYDAGGSGLASVEYQIDDGATQTYEGPFVVTGTGERTVVATATDGDGNTTERSVTFTIVSEAVSDAVVDIVNLDASRLGGEPAPGFWDDWLVMHRINSGTTTHAVHDTATFEIHNRGTSDDLTIHSLTSTSQQFEIDAPAAPFTIGAGDSVSVEVTFVSTDGPRGVRSAQLLARTDSAGDLERTLQLRGLWMARPEGGNEVTATDLVQAFGYTTDLDEPLTEENSSPLAGDEVRSNFWERAVASEPILVRQIAAFHGCCTSGDRFEFKSTTGGNLGGFNHDPAYGQTIYPLKASGQGGGKAELVWNDPPDLFQITSANYSSNTSGNLGIRTWPVIDRDGEVVPHTWFVIQDFVQQGCGSGSANCDYNDNVYIISNIAPEGEAPDSVDPDPVDGPIRINAGGPEVTIGGQTWVADRYQSGGRPYTNESLSDGDIGGTDDDVLYLTEYSSGVDQGTIAYDIPVDNGTYEVRLHFAEIFFGATDGGPGGSGQRVFDVEVEGSTFLNGLDIIEEVGTMTALVETTQVEVTDGELNLSMTASVNQPKVSAIEVLPVTDTVRINAGGATQTIDGVTWQGCDTLESCGGYVSGGSAYLEPALPTFTGVPSDLNEAVFETEWTGGTVSGVDPGEVAFSFDIPVSDGEYDVVLHFAELNKAEPGTRIFDVVLQGETVLGGLDLWDTAGLGGAFGRQFTAEVSDGMLAIEFVTRTENAKISAIEIVPAGEGRGSYGATE